MSETRIDTENKFIVCARGNDVGLLAPMKTTRMTREEALNLAAWLVALADEGDGLWERTLEAVQNT